MTPDRIVRTVCSPNCSGTCGINVFVKDEQIQKIEPATYPEPGFERICLKGIAMAMQRVHHPDRLTHPLQRIGERGSGEWRRISWDDAFAMLADRLSQIARTYGAPANAWMTMSGNYGFKATTSPERIANCLGGTYFTNGGMMGDLSCAMGFIPALGVGAVCNDLADFRHAKYILNFGRNIADTDHCEMRFLLDAIEAGAKFVMVDPRFSRSAAKAHEWISPRPGADAALVLGMINEIITRGLADEPYVRRHTNACFLVDPRSQRLLRERDVRGGAGDGFLVFDEAMSAVVQPGRASTPALHGVHSVRLADGSTLPCPTAWQVMLDAWRAFTPERAADICEVPVETIRRIAVEYATTSPAWLWCGAGPQRYHHGHLAHRAYVTLAAICGNIGKPYAGVNCLDGAHMRFTFNPPEEWTAPRGQRGRVLPGVHMQEIIASGAPYAIKSLWLSSYGFASQSPNFDRFVRDVLPHLDLFVVTEQLMTPAAQYADLVLPCVSYYEDDMDLVAGGENWWLQLRRRAIAPVGESKNDYDIFAGVCERMGRGEDWRMAPEEICELVLAKHPDPDVRRVDWRELRERGVARIEIERPHVPFKGMRFATPSGRIELYTEAFVAHGEAVATFIEPLESARRPLASKYPLALISHKHVHSTHSQHTMLPWIRELLPEPRLEIHPSDAAARNVNHGDLVRVFNDRGACSLPATVSEAVKPGMVSLPQGFWRSHFRSGHHGDLAQIVRNEVQEKIIETNYPVWDILVEVERLEGAA